MSTFYLKLTFPTIEVWAPSLAAITQGFAPLPETQGINRQRLVKVQLDRAAREKFVILGDFFCM